MSQLAPLHEQSRNTCYLPESSSQGWVEKTSFIDMKEVVKLRLLGGHEVPHFQTDACLLRFRDLYVEAWSAWTKAT